MRRSEWCDVIETPSLLDIASFITIVVIAAQYYLNNVHGPNYISGLEAKGRSHDDAIQAWNQRAHRFGVLVFILLIAAVALGLVGIVLGLASSKPQA